MSDLEYDLWRIVRGGARNYGRIDLTDEQLGRLRRLSERAGGWVHYTDLVAEQFVPLDEWEKLCRVWESAPGGAD